MRAASRSRARRARRLRGEPAVGETQHRDPALGRCGEVTVAGQQKALFGGAFLVICDVIARTAAASGKRDGSIRYWISAGPGSLGLPPAAGAEPGFFVMIHAGLAYPDTWYSKGLRVMTTTYPAPWMICRLA